MGTNSPASLRGKDIVAAAIDAAGGQAQLAKQLGVSQSAISKYKTGTLDAPTQVLLSCLKISGLWSSDQVTATELARRIERDLPGEEFTAVRQSISQLLNAITQRRRGAA